MASASDMETKAKEAFIDDHFELAIDLYSQAISLNPKHPELFADRAQTNIKLHNFTADLEANESSHRVVRLKLSHGCHQPLPSIKADPVELGTPDAEFCLSEAVADANRAIELDPSMAKAYLRKGTACIKLEEYQTAKDALEIGASLASGDSKFINLIKECDERIAEEAGMLPRLSVDKALTDNVTSVSQTSGKTDVPPKDAEPVNNLSDHVKALPSSKPKYRHEFYQKPEEVVVTIFAKGVPASSVTVDFGEQILSVTVDVPDEEAYIFQPRLFGKIVPVKCKYEVLSTKIEIRLAKAEAIHWTSLEFTKNSSVPQQTYVSSSAQMPVYPTSKPKAVDWDKLEAEVKKEEKEEKLDGDAALNKFFRDIYQDADEDTRRAMRKSFVESNGTVLSTNWKEVGSKKVEGSAPDGMEMRKWEY